jgi:hypothetical protein
LKITREKKKEMNQALSGASERFLPIKKNPDPRLYRRKIPSQAITDDYLQLRKFFLSLKVAEMVE